MKKRHPVLASEDALTIDELDRLCEGWYLDGEVRQFTERTLGERKRFTRLMLWFFRDRNFQAFDTAAIRALLAHVSRGHLEPAGRWGQGLKTPVKPRTAEQWFDNCQALCNWIAEERDWDTSPMGKIRPPLNQADQIIPFTQEQVIAIRDAARRSTHPRRDEAMVLFLLDNGVRASELAGIVVRDLDITGKRCRIHGKGHKDRMVPFGQDTSRALWRFVQEEKREADAPLFPADRGPGTDESLTRSGVFQLIRRLGRAAKIEAIRCSPHTFRHTFAIEFLRNGGNQFTLMEILGHTSLVMTRRYVQLAQADVERQHRVASPVDRLKRKR